MRYLEAQGIGFETPVARIPFVPGAILFDLDIGRADRRPDGREIREIAGRLIQYGDADVMIAGGAEMAFTPLGVGSFCQAKALSQRNDDPKKASRPFDLTRDGFVMSEGASIIILEDYEYASRRGAERGRLSLSLAGSKPVRISAQLLSDLGELVTIDKLEAPVEVPTGAYRVASVEIELVDDAGENWSYSFREDKGEERSVQTFSAALRAHRKGVDPLE